MSYKDALKLLGIEDFSERIFNSNSHGELSHCFDYIVFAQRILHGNKNFSTFRPLFLECVKIAEQNWKRPESVFQHMPRMIGDLLAAAEPIKNPDFPCGSTGVSAK